MAKMIKLTPETFVEVFMLCLHWQWQPVSLHHTFTTVDKVLKILSGLGCVTEAQVTYLQGKTTGVEYQRLLRRRICMLFSASRGLSRSKKDREEMVPTMLAQDVLRQEKALCCLCGEKVPSLGRLIRDARIHLTYVGSAEARSLESKYSDFLTREEYKEEEKRRDEMFRTVAASASAAKAYQEGLPSEEGGKQNRKGGTAQQGPRCTLTKLW